MKRIKNELNTQNNLPQQCSRLFFVLDFIMLLQHNIKAVTLSGRKEVHLMFDIIIPFIVSVAASIAAYYICKWLDRYL